MRSKPKPGSFRVVPNAGGKTACVVAGISDPPSLWDLGNLPNKLPADDYRLEWEGPLAYQEWLALGWALGGYRFTRYKKNDDAKHGFACPKDRMPPRSNVMRPPSTGHAI